MTEGVVVSLQILPEPLSSNKAYMTKGLVDMLGGCKKIILFYCNEKGFVNPGFNYYAEVDDTIETNFEIWLPDNRLLRKYYKAFVSNAD